MSKVIKAIDKEAVHRICSGQVVLNLATAIKELVENSLDAGATTVEVRLREHGSELIEVSDNGSGVLPSNFEGLTAKHHTSKLQDFSDLVNVETFGFRGEALSSLCALSTVTIVTKHESETIGSKLVFDQHGNIISNTPIARQVGTTVSVENLFKSLPVRQKEFHRNLKREYLKMIQLLNAYGIISTNVRISCINSTKKGGRSSVMATHGCKTVRENIASVFGAKQVNSLLDLKKVLPNDETLEDLKVKKEEADIFELEGLISSCAHGQGRSSSDRQFFYINNRPCEPAKIVKCVNEVYHSFNLHQTPFVFLNVSVAKHSVDVNVTPDKRQIFLDHEKLLIATVKASLVSLYEKIPSTYQVNNTFTSQTLLVPSSCSLRDEGNEKPTSPKISFLNKWKHSSSKDFPETATNKRKNESKNSSSKQLKLDSTISVTMVSSQDSGCCSLSEKLSSSDCLSSSTLASTSQNSAENSYSYEIVDINSLKSVEDEICVPKNTKESHLAFSDSSELNESSNCDMNKMDDKSSDLELTQVEINSGTLNEGSPIFNHESKGSEDRISNSPETNEASSEPKVIVESQLIVDKSTPKDSDSMKALIVKNVSVESIKQKLNQLKCEESRKDELCSRNKFHATIDPTKNQQAESELNREISKDMFAKMEIIGQFNLGFIIVQLGTDLFIVDQHATDEKYNFETLQQKTVLSSQKLVVPQNLDLTAANESILIDNMDIFKCNGFEFIFDENADPMKRVKLTAIPMSENWHFGKEDIDELLFMLQDSPGAMCRPSRVRSMFASRACRMSVMIGTALSQAEMKRLVVHMGEIEQPWNCPHGRPTMRHLINLSLIN